MFSLDTVVCELDGLSRRNLDKSFLGGVRGDEYCIGIFDKGFKLKFPFVVNREIFDVVNSVCEGYDDKFDRSMRLYAWIIENIRYGERRRGRKGYRNSVETFQDREGVCGEMAALYIAMTRCVGIRSSYVYVAVDDAGDSVNHACAMIDLPGHYRSTTLVDLSYPRFDANHGKFRPYSDFEIFEKFNS